MLFSIWSLISKISRATFFVKRGAVKNGRDGSVNVLESTLIEMKRTLDFKNENLMDLGF